MADINTPEKLWLDRYIVDPIKDIEPSWDCMKMLAFNNANEHSGCFNCNAKVRQELFRSVDRTVVTFCAVCTHLSIIYYKDVAGGTMGNRKFDTRKHDIVKCYMLKPVELKSLVENFSRVDPGGVDLD